MKTPHGGVIQLNFPLAVAVSICPSLEKVVAAGARRGNSTSECLTENIWDAETQLATRQPQAGVGLGAGKGREASGLGGSGSARCPASSLGARDRIHGGCSVCTARVGVRTARVGSGVLWLSTQ